MLQKQTLDFLARKATAVMTNVPGPQQPLYMAGARIRRIMAWVPQSGDIGVGVSILSYSGGVQFGLITDKRLCPEPQRIIDRVRAGVREDRAGAVPAAVGTPRRSGRSRVMAVPERARTGACSAPVQRPGGPASAQPAKAAPRPRR